jgi:hypothetical protein
VGNQFQGGDAPADGHLELVPVNDSGKLFATALMPGSFPQEIIVLGEQDTPQFRGSIQQFIVWGAVEPVFLRGHDVYTTQSHPVGDRPSDVNVHVQSGAHGEIPRSRKRLRNGESPRLADSWLTSSRRRSISASMSV